MVHGQNEARTYLNEVLAVTTKKQARYYRVNEGASEDLFIGLMYTIEGRLVSVGTYADPELLVEHGLFTYYHANGQVESKGEYVMGHKTGLWERYNAQGSPLAEKVYDPKALENIIYTRAQTMPVNPKGNEKEFIRYLKETVTTVGGKRVKGTVMTSFIVEKDGTLSDVKVVNGRNEELDQQVVQAIKTAGQWQPGSERGQPVRVCMRVPVKF